MSRVVKIIRTNGTGTGTGGGPSTPCTFSGTPIMPTGNISGLSSCDFVNTFFQAQAPLMSIRSSASFGLYEIGATVTNPQIEGRGTLGTNAVGLSLLELFRGNTGGTSLGTQANPASGTWYPMTDTISITTNQTYSGRVTQNDTQTGTASASFTFVYPWYATTNTITFLTKQALQNGGNYYQFTSVAETDTDKEKCDIVATETITGIEFYNTVSGKWEWLNGGKAASLSSFTTSAVNHTVQGNVVAYTRFTHNSVKVGVRQMRFWRT